MIYGGSGMEKETIDFILKRINSNSVVVEFGSGDVSTPILKRKCKLISVESNLAYHKKYHDNYIYAPIIDGWYDHKILAEKLPSTVDLYVIDGPAGNRDVMLDYMGMFDARAGYIFHDTYRDKEILLANKVSKYLSREVTFHKTKDKDFFAEIKREL